MEDRSFFPRVAAVLPLPGKRLSVEFSDGSVKVYDCNPLLAEVAFKPIASEALFRAVRADPAGYGVIWTDEIDLAESELWINGKDLHPR